MQKPLLAQNFIINDSKPALLRHPLLTESSIGFGSSLVLHSLYLAENISSVIISINIAHQLLSIYFTLLAS